MYLDNVIIFGIVHNSLLSSPRKDVLSLYFEKGRTNRGLSCLSKPVKGLINLIANLPVIIHRKLSSNDAVLPRLNMPQFRREEQQSHDVRKRGWCGFLSEILLSRAWLCLLHIMMCTVCCSHV